MKNIRVCKITHEGVTDEVINDDLKTFYDEISCDTIDMITRKVGRKTYCIICDDNWLINHKPKLTDVLSYCPHGECIFGDSILIAGCSDFNGDITSLKDDDVLNIKSHFSLKHNQLIHGIYSDDNLNWRNNYANENR
jgi:hypothetical protein